MAREHITRVDPQLRPRGNRYAVDGQPAAGMYPDGGPVRRQRKP